MNYPDDISSEGAYILLRTIGGEIDRDLSAGLLRIDPRPIPEVVFLLKDGRVMLVSPVRPEFDPAVKMHWAASTLNDMHEAAAPAAKELDKALKDPALSVRGQAVSALRHLKAKAAPALDSLIDALTHKESTIRGSAAYILGTLGEVAEPALEPLIQALNDPEPVVSMNAAGALGSLKAKAAKAIPFLEAARDAATPDLERSCADPLTRIRFHLMP